MPSKILFVILAALAVTPDASAETSVVETGAPAAPHGDFKTRDLLVRYGAISDTGHLSSFPAEKLFLLAYRADWKLLTYQYEVGGIFDGRDGAKSSLVGTFSAGFETKTMPFYAFYLPGLALITGPDNYLSSFYQFSHDAGIGVKDGRGVSVDFTYRHFSNAGIHLPNPGRNYLVLTLGFPASALGF